MTANVVIGVADGESQMLIAAREVLDESNSPVEWRAALGERTGLRPDLTTNLKTALGWANRANREFLVRFFTESPLTDVPHAGNHEIALTATNYARSVYDSTGSDGEGGRVYREVVGKDKIVARVTDRKTTYTGITLTEKESQGCPSESCGGYLHPVTFMCGRCKMTFPEGGKAVIRSDVANRFEPTVRMLHLFFEADGSVSITVRVCKRRGGSDVAGLNPEKWAISARWPGNDLDKRGYPKASFKEQRFGLGSLTSTAEIGGGTTFLPVTFHASQEAQAREFGISIIGRGPNMGVREVTE